MPDKSGFTHGQGEETNYLCSSLLQVMEGWWPADAAYLLWLDWDSQEGLVALEPVSRSGTPSWWLGAVLLTKGRGLRAHRTILLCKFTLSCGPELLLQHPAGVRRETQGSGGSDWAVENGDLAANREEVSGQNMECVFPDVLVVVASLSSDSLVTLCP